MGKYRVRFNLGRGDNYMKWQIKDMGTNVRNHYEPNSVSLIMENCLLSNNKKTSEKIFNGSNKSVCAWVECDNVIISDTHEMPSDVCLIRYNPRIKPNWIYDKDVNKDLDGHKFNKLITNGKNIYIDV